MIRPSVGTARGPDRSHMVKFTAEAKVGILVVGSAIILLWMTVVVGKFDLGRKEGYRLVAVFDSVAGLEAKAAVRMAGVRIGAVESVNLRDGKAKLTLRIEPGVNVPRGSTAAVKTMGLLGDKYIDLVPPQEEGMPDGPVVSGPGDE